MSMNKEKALRDVNRIRDAVAPEYERLNVDFCGFWPSSKAKAIADAGNILASLINEIEERSAKVKNVKPVHSEMSFLLNLDLSTICPNRKAGDLDERQLIWEEISSVEKMMDFKLRTWVEARTYTYEDGAGNERTRHTSAGWKCHGSMRSALGIARYNPFTTLFNADMGALWGKSKTLSNVEDKLAIDEEHLSQNSI